MERAAITKGKYCIYGNKWGKTLRLSSIIKDSFLPSINRAEDAET